MSALHIAVMLGAVFYLLRIAVADFRTLRISNRDNLIMMGLALAALALRGPASLGGDLIAGGALFLLGLLFWLRGAMGAGDAKLFPSLGVLVGWQGLSAFAILLLAASILLLAAIKLGPRVLQKGDVSARLSELRTKGTAPYGVPLALAGAGTIAARLLSGYPGLVY